MVGSLKVADQIRQIHIRFRNVNDYEPYFNAIGQDYESQDTIFNGYIYKLNTLLFNLVKRSKCNGCDFKHEVFGFQGVNCFIPTKGYCFVKCINFLTGKHYKEQTLHFIRHEKRRTNISTKSRIFAEQIIFI